MPVPKALTIAGSDSGGGAGIQADLKTFAALGVYGSSVITAITAQNTLGVKESAGIPAELAASQLDEIMADIGADAVKTGMMHNHEVIEAISSRLQFYKPDCLVVDPVMVATSGDPLLNGSGMDVLRQQLLPLAHCITPNQDEAAVLCGWPLDSEQAVHRAAGEIYKMGAGFVIITGIRQGMETVDHCYDGVEHRRMAMPFIETASTHGTGCTFSAALAAFRARGLSFWQAVPAAQQYIACGLRYAYPVGAGHGPLNHQAGFFPGRLEDPDILALRAGACRDWGRQPDLGKLPLLNVIIGGLSCQGRDYAELTRMAVQNGAGLVQLREKEGDTRQLVECARMMVRICHEQGARLVVNDRVDVAIAAGADGVHVGQEDLPPALARALLGPGKIVGVSASNWSEAEAAVAAGADYLGVGPVYPTASKDCVITECGTDLLAAIAARFKVPIIAIGGITAANIAPVMEAGASGVAVISAVACAADPAAAVRELYQKMI